jgi:hypothetical protein
MSALHATDRSPRALREFATVTSFWLDTGKDGAWQGRYGKRDVQGYLHFVDRIVLASQLGL